MKKKIKYIELLRDFNKNYKINYSIKYAEDGCYSKDQTHIRIRIDTDPNDDYTLCAISLVRRSYIGEVNFLTFSSNNSMKVDFITRVIKRCVENFDDLDYIKFKCNIVADTHILKNVKGYHICKFEGHAFTEGKTCRFNIQKIVYTNKEEEKMEEKKILVKTNELVLSEKTEKYLLILGDKLKPCNITTDLDFSKLHDFDPNSMSKKMVSLTKKILESTELQKFKLKLWHFDKDTFLEHIPLYFGGIKAKNKVCKKLSISSHHDHKTNFVVYMNTLAHMSSLLPNLEKITLCIDAKNTVLENFEIKPLFKNLQTLILKIKNVTYLEGLGRIGNGVENLILRIYHDESLTDDERIFSPRDTTQYHDFPTNLTVITINLKFKTSYGYVLNLLEDLTKRLKTPLDVLNLKVGIRKKHMRYMRYGLDKSIKPIIMELGKKVKKANLDFKVHNLLTNTWEENLDHDYLILFPLKLEDVRSLLGKLNVRYLNLSHDHYYTKRSFLFPENIIWSKKTHPKKDSYITSIVIIVILIFKRYREESGNNFPKCVIFDSILKRFSYRDFRERFPSKKRKFKF